MRRLRFVRAASASGWQWLVEVTNHVGAVVILLLLVGVSIVSAVRLPHWWYGLVILAATYMLLFGEGAYRVWNETAVALEDAQGRLGQVDSRTSLIGFLKESRDSAAGLANWIAGGLVGTQYNDARGLVDDWSAPISLRLLQYDPKLAVLFDDDGDSRYQSRHASEALERRFEQLAKVIADLESRND